MKVMNGLVTTLKEDKRFLCLAVLYYVSNYEGKISIMSYFMRSFFSQCLQQQ